MASATIPTLHFQRVLILGLGETGTAAARWCHRHGAELVIADSRAQPPGLELLQQEIPDAAYRLGLPRFDCDLLDGICTLVLSPGLSPYQEDISHLLRAARERGIAVSGEAELFAQALQTLAAVQGYEPCVLCVTGTNGKTTVTEMTAVMIEHAGLSVCAAGNISPSCLTALMQVLDRHQLPEVWVLELSSFQIGTLQSLEPRASAVLNITQDHLDWHGSMQNYIDHKLKLLAMSRLKIVNVSDPVLERALAGQELPGLRRVSDQPPRFADDLGLQEEAGALWITACEAHQPAASSSQTASGGQAGNRQSGQLVRLLPASALQLQGRHNALNTLAALALARAAELPWTPLVQGAQAYTAAPHRMNFVRTIHEVEFINDSKGTNVGATLAAISGLDRRIVLIMGGLGKGQDFFSLVEPLRAKARAVMLIGRDAPLIQETLAASGVPLTLCGTLEEAVEGAFEAALPHDVVLFSPACASMDMFKNYAHRGDMFVVAVQDLALEKGEIL